MNISLKPASPFAENTASYEARTVKKIGCDVLIVGSGPSGLAACVQAAELGLHTVLIEATGSFGGNGHETEGVFAIGSDMQAKLGIDITLRQIVESECKLFNYTIDALLWRDLVEASADNIRWLLKHGVGFSGIVDDCKGDGEMSCFHWFHKRSSDGRGDGSLLTTPLLKAARELGSMMLSNMRGMELIIQDEKVAGLYAQDQNTGEVTKFSCMAVILATGGFADNVEMMEQRGFDMEHMFHRGDPGRNGDGWRMAVSAGAGDMSRHRTYLLKLHIFPLHPYSTTTLSIHQMGYTIWVNGNGERYANELCGEHMKPFFQNAKLTQDKTYSVFDASFIENNKKNAPDLDADLKSLLGGPHHNCYKADSIEELAVQAGIDPSTLKATVTRYNDLCAKGNDADFAKRADRMIAIDTPPYYIVRQDLAIWTSIGAIRTNRRFEAVNLQGKPVPGLYAVGVDGCELYRDSYSLSVPGSCNGNNINSGRTAARSAFKYIKE